MENQVMYVDNRGVVHHAILDDEHVTGQSDAPDVVPYQQQLEQQPEPLRWRRIATPTQRSERYRNTSSTQYSWLPDGWEAEERRWANGLIDTYYYAPGNVEYRSRKRAIERMKELGHVINENQFKRRRRDV